MAQLSTHLGQQHHPLPVRPDDMVHLGADPLPGQLRRPQAGLEEEEEEAGVTAGAGRRARPEAPALTTSISVLEWPMLHTMQLFFIRSRCSLVTTFLFPAGTEGTADPTAVGTQTLWFSPSLNSSQRSSAWGNIR